MKFTGRKPEPPRIRERRRAGRCYELCGRGHLLDETWTLIHGRAAFWDLQEMPFLIAHAWLEKGGYVYDTTLDAVMTVKQYAKRCGAVTERRYTAPRAEKLMLKTGLWGPWHPCDVITVEPRLLRTLERSVRKRRRMRYSKTRFPTHSNQRARIP